MHQPTTVCMLASVRHKSWCMRPVQVAPMLECCNDDRIDPVHGERVVADTLTDDHT